MQSLSLLKTSVHSTHKNLFARVARTANNIYFECAEEWAVRKSTTNFLFFAPSRVTMQQTRNYAKKLKRKEWLALSNQKLTAAGKPPIPERKFEPQQLLRAKTYPALVEIRQQNSNVPRITHKDLKTLLDSTNDNVVVIDLRDSEGGDPPIPKAGKLPCKCQENTFIRFLANQ